MIVNATCQPYDRRPKAVAHDGVAADGAWAQAIELANLSNVALFGRLRNAVPWLESIPARLLAPVAASSRGACSGVQLIRLVDATTVRNAGKSARESGRLWRVHAVFDLSTERFSAFELTDEMGAEGINRMSVISGELRIGDAVHCRADELADVTEQGGDVLVRAGWKRTAKPTAGSPGSSPRTRRMP